MIINNNSNRKEKINGAEIVTGTAQEQIKKGDAVYITDSLQIYSSVNGVFKLDKTLSYAVGYAKNNLEIGETGEINVIVNLQGGVTE